MVHSSRSDNRSFQDSSGASGSPRDVVAGGLRQNKLKDYTVDDSGRRIPAPPHEDREELLKRYQRRDFKDSNVNNKAKQKTGDAAKIAQSTFHLQDRRTGVSNNVAKAQISSSPAFTEPLFPPLPLYGPPSHLRSIQISLLRCISFCCTLSFLLVIILGALFTSFIPQMCDHVYQRVLLRDPDRNRKFIVEERRREKQHAGERVKLTDQVPYYANLVDIDVEQVTCETLDGFTLHLQRLRDRRPQAPSSNKKYPVLMLHGLLQSAGAFCVNDEDSLAFYLCRQGFDVWLGNNRCWTHPEHSALTYSDPRLWAWNIRQLGGLDLPVLVRTVCERTNRERIGFIAHSQGTTQTFCSLSRDQKPEIGLSLDSFCALAPAVYAGALIDKLQFKFMRVLGPSGFRLFFGINAFIPFMMTMHSVLPGSWYGQVGFYVFHFLFGWSDQLWGERTLQTFDARILLTDVERRLKTRFFQFSPVYVSAESMRWWMRDFAIYRSILEETEEVWYSGECFPPLAFWTCGQDKLVDHVKFTNRMNDYEKELTIVHQECIPEYSHLDCLWAMDACERIGTKLKEVLWACATDKAEFVIPIGCENIKPVVNPRQAKSAKDEEAANSTKMHATPE